MPQVRAGVPVLTRLVQHRDAEVKIDAMWALSYLCDGANERIEVCLFGVE